MLENIPFSLFVLGVGIVPLDCLYYHEPGASEPLLLEAPGGTVTNMLCALATLGACETSLIGMVGDDDAGHRILEHCKSFGISADGLLQKPRALTRHLRIDMFPQPDGPAYQRIHREFNEKNIASPGGIQLGAWWRLTLWRLNWLHCDATAAPVQAMVKQAADAGKIVSYDFGRFARWGMQGPLDILQYCAVFKTNRHLLSCLFGDENLGDGALLFERFPALRVVLITDAANGMELLWKADSAIRRVSRNAYPVSGGGDALGAGDAALAMLIHRLSAVRELWWNGNAGFSRAWAKETLSKAAAISALCCRHRSACGYLLHLREQERGLADALLEIEKAG